LRPTCQDASCPLNTDRRARPQRIMLELIGGSGV
jgi:hypothetical protein